MATDVVTAGRTGDDAELESMVATLSDPQRLAIYRTLLLTPGMGSTELAARLDLFPATVRKQLRALMELGMVHVQEREVRRGMQKLYFACTRHAWLTERHDAALSRRQRQTVDLNILRNIVADARRALARSDYGTRLGRMVAGDSATVDDRAWQELSELQHEMLERMTAIIDAGRARQSENGADEETVSIRTALLLLELPAESREEEGVPSSV
jgi:DNA-binding transcriptional ArsR family regulator